MFYGWEDYQIRKLYQELNPYRSGDRAVIRYILDELEMRGTRAEREKK